MRALTFRAVKHANSSAKSFVTLSGDREPLLAKRLYDGDPLVWSETSPEFEVGLAFLFKGGALADPWVHGPIITAPTPTATAWAARSSGSSRRLFDLCRLHRMRRSRTAPH